MKKGIEVAWFLFISVPIAALLSFTIEIIFYISDHLKRGSSKAQVIAELKLKIARLQNQLHDDMPGCGTARENELRQELREHKRILAELQR